MKRYFISEGLRFCIGVAFADEEYSSSIIEDLLIWTYDETETDKEYLDRIYFAAGLLRCIVSASRSKDLALINLLYIFQYKRVVRKLLKSNRSVEFKKSLPKDIPMEYNIYNFGSLEWIDDFFRNNKKCYDDEFMVAYIGG